MQNKNRCQIENHTSDTENWNDIVSEKFQNRKLEDERWCDIILLGSFMLLVGRSLTGYFIRADNIFYPGV